MLRVKAKSPAITPAAPAKIGQMRLVDLPVAPQRRLITPLASQNMPIKLTNIGLALSGWMISAKPKNTANAARAIVTQKGICGRLDLPG